MVVKNLKTFMNFLSGFNTVERQVYIRDKTRFENDAEHSYQLATVSWYLVESLKLKLDLKKVFQYALAHDLVEIYAGDVGFFRNKKVEKEKILNEKKALKRIWREFPEARGFHKIIEQYEKLEDKESRFVYAIDKMLPVINIYLDNGRSWRRDGVTYEMLESKTAKISKSKEVLKIWTALYKEIGKNKKELFGTPK